MSADLNGPFVRGLLIGAALSVLLWAAIAVLVYL